MQKLKHFSKSALGIEKRTEQKRKRKQRVMIRNNMEAASDCNERLLKIKSALTTRGKKIMTANFTPSNPKEDGKPLTD